MTGGIYLCQVSEKISCAACCGLYNVANCSFDALMDMLSNRTERFGKLPRTANAICEFGRQVASSQTGDRPWDDFHHCPFIGLIGDCRQRVGCLLHPLAQGNEGIDYRGLSYYGGMACRRYFCPSYRNLAPVTKKFVRRLAGNWYEYGLVVTESLLLGALVSAIETRLSVPLPLDRVADSDSPAVVRAMREVLFLKMHWPYRRGTAEALCHYFFSDRRYVRGPVDYSMSGRHPSVWDTIFKELNSGFQTADELRGAERRLEDLLRQAAKAVQGTLL